MGWDGRLLRSVHDNENFATTIRNVMLVGIAIALGSEALGLILPAIPPDPLGTAIASGVMAGVAFAGHLGLRRERLAWGLVAVAGVIGWYHARVGRNDVELLLANQGAIFVFIAAAHGVLPLSVVEFLGTLLLYLLSLIGSLLWFTRVEGGQFVLLGFYSLGAAIVAAFGIVGRARLQEGQRQANLALETLNDQLETKVKEQVRRIARADLLRRFLPPEVTDPLLTGDENATIIHVRRDVAVLCAAPTGFLESLAPLDAERVVEFVNAYVSTMSQVAFDHGGVVERVVGPRMTVIFGAMSDMPAERAMDQALGMASRLQKDANQLLLDWERRGFHAVKLRLAVGIAYGSTVVGTFGSERRVDYSALGAAMVRAVRLSSEAIPGEIRIDDEAARHLPAGFQRVPAEPVEFNPGEPVPCFIALAHSTRRELPKLEAPSPESMAHGVTLSPATLRVRQASSTRGDKISTPAVSFGEPFDGRYKLEALVGKGGMATVYRARHLALGQLCALKIVSPARLDTPDAVEQFRREAEATARIHHPNVVRLHDFGRSLEGHYYLVLDFVSGPSLAQRLEHEGALSVAHTLALGHQVLSALEAAHERGLVHQDLKPSNVMLDAGGHALVTDFGLVTTSGTQTSEASCGGTPAYMSPEQWLNHPLDQRSDLYAWGVMMYELLSGRLPLDGNSLAEFAAIAVYQDPAPLQEPCPQLPAGLCRLIDECLYKRPEDRPASARATAQRLEAWLHGDVEVIPSSAAALPPRSDDQQTMASIPDALGESGRSDATARIGTPPLE